MIQVKTSGPVEEKYRRWRERAEAARDQMIQDWTDTGKPPNPEKHQKIWAEFKELFLHEVFHEKCAYCEANALVTGPFHVEHYRPKKAVTEQRQPITHTGYFWLALEWYNLLLSCHHCNTSYSGSRRKKTIGHPGKANEFRITGRRVPQPSPDPTQWQTELVHEQPLLLNPYFDDPAQHIAFDHMGVAYAKGNSERGKETIEVCNLNRQELITARQKATEAVEARMIKRLQQISESLKAGLTVASCVYYECSEPFSAWLNHFAETLKKSL